VQVLKKRAKNAEVSTVNPSKRDGKYVSLRHSI
jgi:hypothetical protein